MKYFKLLILFGIFLNLHCAQIVAPNGGAKDETPPQVVSETPLNQSINFSSKEITIKFDEFINLTNQDQIVISPLIEPKPIIDYKGKEVTVNFKELPEKDKTYTINFANAIVDNHEGIAIEGYTYVFATGAILDSNLINGLVIDAFNLKPQKDFIVALYYANTFTDTTAQKLKPAYFSKTNEQGLFTIKNLPNDSFILIAFLDENKNYQLELNEKVAFKKEPINTSNLIENITLYSYNQNTHSANFVTDTLVAYKGVYQFAVYKPTNFKAIPESKTNYFTRLTKGKNNLDSFWVFVPSFIDENKPESFLIKTPTDSAIINLKTSRKLKAQPLKISVQADIKLLDTLILTFNNPITKFNAKQLTVKEDTLFIEPNFSKLIDPFTLKLFTPWKEKTNYTITLSDSCLNDAFNQLNHKHVTNISTKSEKDYGMLILNLVNKNNLPLIVQLVDESEDELLLDELLINKTTNKTYKYFVPATFKIKVILDSNRNGVWDNGDLDLKIQPETVKYHKESYNIRAYWDMEQTINLDDLFSAKP